MQFESNPVPANDPSKSELRPHTQVFTGTLFAWFETGTEGLVWSVQQAGTSSYDGLIVLQKGDHLKILDESGDSVFDGIIDPDFRAGWTPFEVGGENGSPAALGFRIHWTQRGYAPDDWASFFLPERYQAQVTRAA